MAVTQDRDPPSRERRQRHVDGAPHRRDGDWPPWLKLVRVWCRQRAHRKTVWAKTLDSRYWHDRVPHSEICAREGLLADDYARIRRWANDARKEAKASGGTVSFEEALVRHEEQQVDLVSRFAILKRRGANRDQIRRQLGLSHDGYDLTSEWLRDALAATRSAQH